jgi:hypothetical protein
METIRSAGSRLAFARDRKVVTSARGLDLG